MIIKSITLTNFRNHETYHLECKPDVTLILGENGSGKTSVLEAIYILMQGKSFRATDPDILKRSKDFYRIELEYENGEKIIATYNGKTKSFQTVDKKSLRLPKKLKYPVILFQPSDLNLISGSPSRHREYFDRLIGQLSSEYQSSLSRYNKALHQRNELLKDELSPSSSLFSWNILLARYGAIISHLREEYTNLINQSLTNTYRTIAENSDDVELVYSSEVKSITESDYYNKLEQSESKDRILGHTSFGVHRDDFEFVFNGSKTNGSASRGETRSIILALKFVEANIINDTLHVKPLVLLDDVFSELDETRRKCLVKNFTDHQVIITSVEQL